MVGKRLLTLLWIGLLLVLVVSQSYSGHGVEAGGETQNYLPTVLKPHPPFWAKIYTGSDSWFTSVQETSDGGPVMAGPYDLSGIMVVRADENGALLWARYFPPDWGNYNQHPKIVELPDGRLAVATSFDPPGSGNRDGVLLLLQPNGEIDRQFAYGGPDDDGFSQMSLTANGDLLVVGGTASFGAAYRNAWVLRIDQNGSVVWQKVYSFPANLGNFGITGAVETTAGDFAIVGWAGRLNGGLDSDGWLFLLDPDGAIRWSRSYYLADDDDSFDAVVAMPDGGLLLGGTSLIRLSTAGTRTWERAGVSVADTFAGRTDTSFSSEPDPTAGFVSLCP